MTAAIVSKDGLPDEGIRTAGRLQSLLFGNGTSWIGARFSDAVRRNPAVVLSASYVAISAMGFLYDHLLLKQFHVGELHYAEVGGFFLGALKRPQLFVGAAIVFLVFYAYRKFALRLRETKPSVMKAALYPVFFPGMLRSELFIVAALLYLLVGMHSLVSNRADSLRRAEAPVYIVETRPDSRVEALVPIASIGPYFLGLPATPKGDETESPSKSVVFIHFNDIKSVRRN